MAITSVKDVLANIGRVDKSKIEGLNAVILFDLSGEGGGTWTATIADGTIKVDEGETATPSMTLSMDAKDLVALLPKAGSSQTQGRIILALSYLNHSAAVEPLLGMLGDPQQATLSREFAAVALGLLGDRRDEDVLFRLDAHFNFFSGTRASRELVRLY